ncbi:hypothetical protein HAX54_053339, partial [Datura stramonium]|nr:hypothetical protein [Datura stramonium]
IYEDLSSKRFRSLRGGFGGRKEEEVAGLGCSWWLVVLFFFRWWLPRNRNYGVGEEKRERKRRAGAA